MLNTDNFTLEVTGSEIPLAEKGRVHLTQSELRKVKLEQWNKAFEYILQASETRKGILRRKIKLTDILKVKTKRIPKAEKPKTPNFVQAFFSENHSKYCPPVAFVDEADR